MARKDDGWRDMTAQDRYDEASRKVARLEKRREEIKRRGAPVQMLARYDADINSAKDERQLWGLVAQDRADDNLRREYERLDMGMT